MPVSWAGPVPLHDVRGKTAPETAQRLALRQDRDKIVVIQHRSPALCYLLVQPLVPSGTNDSCWDEIRIVTAPTARKAEA